MLKNKCIYIVSLILIGAMAILYDEYYTGVIFIVVLVLPFILFAILVITWSNVKAKILTNSYVANKEDLFEINIRVINKSIFPVSRMDISLEYGNQYSKEMYKEKIQISMDKHCKQEVSTKVSSSYCGNLTFQLITIKVYDFFHIFALTKRLRKSITISILPTYHSIEDFIEENVAFISDSNEYSPYKSGDDPSEVFQIREYREGDKSSRIHRKLSYKYNEMMMKEYSYPINTKILTLLDLYCGQNKENKIEIVDSLLHVFFATSLLGIDNNQKQSIFYKTGPLEGIEVDVSSENEMYELLEDLFTLDIPKDYATILQLHMEYDMDEGYSHMTIISYYIDVEGIISWLNIHVGTMITVMYVNYLDTNPITKEDRLILESLYIKVFEIDIRNMKTSLTL